MRISDWSSDVCSSDLPLDLEGLVRCANYARHLNADGPLADVRERLRRACIVAKELGGGLRDEIVGAEPIASHQDGVERHSSHVADEFGQMPRDLRIGGRGIRICRSDGTGFATTIDFDNIRSPSDSTHETRVRKDGC